jgi:hypothetical protein
VQFNEYAEDAILRYISIAAFDTAYGEVGFRNVSLNGFFSCVL